MELFWACSLHSSYQKPIWWGGEGATTLSRASHVQHHHSVPTHLEIHTTLHSPGDMV